MPVVESGRDHHCFGTPVNGTDEVQTLTIGGTPTTGTFQLGFGGQVTTAIDWTDVDATLMAAIDAALEALTTIGADNVAVAAGTLSSGVGTVTITFGADLGKLALPLITVEDNSLDGDGTLAVAQTTPGVTATARSAAAGETLEDNSGNGYINMGAAGAPVWLPLG